MKKILYSVFMLATMVLAACSSDDTTEPVVKRGMVLKANVEDTDTRATITDTEGKWKFAFATGDVLKVGNDKVESYYTFTNDGTVFASTDAKQTAEAANWCAFFPGETIDLRNQSGKFADVANKYALAGATASATTGSDGLTVTMKAKAAVLRIVGVNKDDILALTSTLRPLTACTYQVLLRLRTRQTSTCRKATQRCRCSLRKAQECTT